MNVKHHDPVPTDINLHQQSRLLTVSFDDGASFEFPCEYLRVYSPSAEVRVAKEQGEVLTGKETVNISAIEPMGNYAVRLVFDDGHDSGVFSWELLYALGQAQENNWQDYLEALATAGVSRELPAEAGSAESFRVNVLYFAWIAEKLGRESEQVLLSMAVKNVGSLLESLRRRGGIWERGFSEENVTVTVNKQFANSDTALHAGDEVGIVPTQPW